jgi:tRNA(adenine34) deaminase
MASELDLSFMQRALELAQAAALLDEVPVGAVLVVDGAVVGEGHNERELANDPTAHAEMLAIARAAKKLERWRLSGSTLYVTLEPCPMCAGALVNARIDRLVYGADDPKAGAVRTLYTIADDPRLNHRVAIESGVLAAESGELLRAFFKAKRK